MHVEKFSLFSAPLYIGRRWLAALCWVLVLATGGTVAMAQTAQFSYAIVPLGGGGNGAWATGLAVDGSGNLYVAYTSADAAKEIPAGCTSISCLITLGGGFSQPGGVAVDGSGNVYVADTNNNAVKEIPAGCASSSCVTTLGGVGTFSGPFGVAVDVSGNIYVADTNNNAVKEMTAGCASSSCVTTLGGGFDNPYSVVLDGNGNIYIADTSNNAVKEMPAGCMLSSCVTTLGGGFNNPNGLAVDGSRNVYVADTQNNLLKVMPAGCVSPSCVTTLGDGFNQPDGVAVDSSGNVYVSDYGNNAVDEVMTRGVNFFSVPVGQSTTETLTFTFTSSGTIGAPTVVMQGAPNLDFTDEGTGTCTTNGPTQNYSPGDICRVDVKFMPRYPGARHGAVSLVNSAGAVIATANLYGTGTGPQVTYPPIPGNPPLKQLGGFNQPYGVAVDGSGNIYIADEGDSAVYEIPSGCASSACVTTLGGGFNDPFGVAVDGGGNVYVADEGNGAVKEIAPGCMSSACVMTLGGGFSRTTGVAVDGRGNIYVTDFDSTMVYEMPSGCTSATCVTTLGGGFNFPYSVAVDDSGNVYVADTFNVAVKKIPLGCTSSACVTNLGGGYTQPRGVAVDGVGNLYVTDVAPNSQEKEIPPGCTLSACVTTLGNVGQSRGVAVDGSGNVYFTNLTDAIVYEMPLSTPPALSFASTAVGATSSDSPQTVTIENSGNAPLSFPIPSAGGNPSISANFSFTASCAAPTALPVSSGGTIQTLAAGAQCALSASFAPTVAGSITGSLVLTDDHLNAASPNYTTQTLNLSGTGTGTAVVPNAPTNVTATAGDGQATVSFTPPASNGGSAIINYTVTSAPGNISVTCNSSPCTIPGLTNGTSYTFTVTATNSVGTSSPSSSSNSVIPSASLQTITFNSPGPQTLGTTPTLTATSTSGLSVTFTSATPAVCTITSGGLLTFISTGTCTINANQAGNGTYSAAAQVSQSFAVNSATTPTLSWGPLAAITYGTPLSAAQLNATATVSGSSIAGSFSYSSAPGTVFAVGMHMLTVNFTPSNTTLYATPGPVTVSLTVTPAPLTVVANSATRIYGTGNPVFTGTVTGAANGNTFAESFSTTATSTSNAGTYAIVPAVTGTSLSDYTVQATNGTLTITQAASSLALSTSASTVTPGQSLTLTVQMSDASSGSTGIPTGTVTFFDGTTQLGTGTLTNGVANLSTSTLAVGMTHSLTASYSGDTNFMASDSSAATTVSVGALGFSFTLNGGGSQTVVLGSTASYNFQVSPTSGAYPGTVSFTATGLPKGATAMFSPSTVSVNSGAQPITMTVQTAATTASTLFKSMTVALSFLLVPLFGLRRRKGMARLLCVALLLLSGGTAATLLSGCAAGNGFFSRAQQNYSITVTATSGSTTQTSVVTLVVE